MAFTGAGFARQNGQENAWVAIGLDNELNKLIQNYLTKSFNVIHNV